MSVREEDSKLCDTPFTQLYIEIKQEMCYVNLNVIYIYSAIIRFLIKNIHNFVTAHIYGCIASGIYYSGHF